jgi:hypothetical protein
VETVGVLFATALPAFDPPPGGTARVCAAKDGIIKKAARMIQVTKATKVSLLILPLSLLPVLELYHIRRTPVAYVSNSSNVTNRNREAEKLSIKQIH